MLANKGKRFVENHVPENVQGLGRGVARVAGAEKAMLANKGKRFIKNHVKPFPKTAFKVSAGVAAASMGVIPMIIGKSGLWMPMGTVICYGTLITMLFLLTVLPVAYMLLFRGSARKRVMRNAIEKM